MTTTIGERIKYVRKKIVGIERSELAELTGIHPNTIRNYEEGLSIPRADLIGRVANALSTTTDYLILGEGDA